MKNKLRKVIDARNDTKGNIKDVLLEGNQNFIPLNQAYNMAQNNQIDLIAVKATNDRKEYIRTPPDGKRKNNLDELAKKHK